jgi:hypothetical protein
VKRIVGYLSKMKHAAIRVRTEEPDYSDLPEATYDWSTSVYGNIKEEIPENAPPPLGKPVVMTTYVDANLYHDYVTGKAVTGIIHFYNQTPIDWYTKKQATVEAATYGAEFVAARAAKEQITAHRTDLRYLGVPVKGSTKTFGDNESVVTSGSIPHSKLSKRHQALSYHSVREGIASGMMSFYHIPGKDNPADILSKHWGYQQVWPTLRPILFWKGNTADLLEHDDDSGTRKGSFTDSILTSPNPVQEDKTDEGWTIVEKPAGFLDNTKLESNDGTNETLESAAKDPPHDATNGDGKMTKNPGERLAEKDTVVKSERITNNATKATEEQVERGSWKSDKELGSDNFVV